MSGVPFTGAARRLTLESRLGGVNVTARWYALVASFLITDSNFTSAPFYIVNGSDTSCLGTVASSSSTSTQGSSTSTTSTSASSGAGSTSTSIALPVDTSPKIDRGAIAGGVIGGLAVIAAAIAYFYLCLGSVDSETNVYPSAPRTRRAADRHPQSSVGPMLDNTVYVIGNNSINSRPSPINDGLSLKEEDEVNPYFSPSQEKFTLPTHGSAPRGHINYNVSMDLISSALGQGVTSSYMNNNFSCLRSHSSSPTTLTSPVYPSGASQDAAAPPVAHRSPMDEVIIAGECRGARCTPRKPVPQYNLVDPALASPPPSRLQLP
ncbi:hypothetical protein DFH07DRAFT_776366 [Mycena maculata]|uniref:Uncharacterized protein n=1 Tax=Mycena maculata TaxID=230809 RepID=A0AAD7N4Q7_9AGAR|nr:hypothetical protein DFH07DRAFT_776366 [Mycena maculata]